MSTKVFFSSGWVCPHVLAALAILNSFDMTTADAHIPVTKKSGGQRKIRGPLGRSDDGARQFSVSYLMDKFIDDPYHPMHWNLVKEFFYLDTEPGNPTRAFLTGQIFSLSEQDGVFIWGVKFSNGKNIYMECEELATAVAHGHRIGLNTTGSLLS